MDPFLKKKWERVFNVFFDTNKSHSLEWNDFEIMIEKIGEMRGKNSDDYKAAQTALHEIWNGLVSLADTNKDNKVSMDEWCEMWRRAEHHDPKWQRDYLAYMFKLLDSSGDKLIDQNEYIEVMRTYGVSDEESTEAFHKISAKCKENKIDFDHFIDLWKQYFHSSDRTAAGNYLFGTTVVAK